MQRELIVFPVAAMVVMAGVVAFRYLFLIIRFRTRGDIPESKPMQAMANVSNMFEMPVFFYVLAVFLYAGDRVDGFYVAGAWLYVLFRLLHTIVHTTYNRIPHRLACFIASNTVMWILWARFVWQSWAAL